MISEQDMLRRYATWLEYWCRAINEQHIADQDAESTDGPIYRDDVDRAINGIIVASLLEGLVGQLDFVKGTSK